MGDRVPDDPELVRRTLAGDRAAFDALVRRYQKNVYRIAQGVLRSASDAEDAVQEVFLRVYRYLPSFDPTRSFEGWLMAIAVNQARGLRQSRRGQAASLDPTGPAYAQSAAPRPSEPAHREIQEAALEALAGLPDRQRDAMLLFLNTDLTLDEIGAALGCSKGTVGAHLHRARIALRRALGRWARPTP